MYNLMKFSNEQFGEIRAMEKDGEPYFVGKDIASKLGYKNINDAIKKHIDEEDKGVAKCDTLGGKQNMTIINESGFFSLVLGSKLPDAKRFKRWVTSEVLPNIRKHGAYISENADEQYVNNELRFSMRRTIKTFANAKASDTKQLYEDFKEYIDKEYKWKTSDRIARYKSVEKGLAKLKDSLCNDSDNIGDCYNVEHLLRQVVLDRTKIEKNSLGGDKCAKTKKIKALENKLSNVVVDKDKFVALDCCGFSENYMYCSIGYNRMAKTKAYKNWIDNFPVEQVPNRDSWNIDWTRPVELFVSYIAKDSMDCKNLDKATIDMLFNRIYKVDDNIVKKVHSYKAGSCNKYEDGKISFYIRNVLN